MSRLLKSLAAALIAATILQPTLTRQASAETVLRLDEIPVGELDPALATDRADSILMFNVYDTLVLPKQGEGGLAPHVAESWTVDGTVYTFKLRSDVKFHSGNTLTADDVVFSYERLKALGKGFGYLFTNVESVEALDAATVRFTLKSAFSPFLASLVRLPIVDRKTVIANLGAGDGEMKDWGAAFLSAHDAGSGAYSVVSHKPQEETVMVKNAGYFLGVPASAPDTARLRYGLEAATVRALIGRGEHDISSLWLPSEVMASAAREGFPLVAEASTGTMYVKMNTQKPPLDDVNCRLALSNAFDYGTALKILAITDQLALGRTPTGAVPAGMIGSNSTDQTLTRDLDAARAYLAKCKYKPEDFTLEITWIGEVPLQEKFALLMQANFGELGFKSEIVKLPWTLFTDRVTKAETTPNISHVLFNAVTGDPDALLYGMYHSSSAGTWRSAEHLKDAEVDRLLDQGRTSFDPAERSAAYSALNKRLMELAPTIYVYDRNNVMLTSKRVKMPTYTDPTKVFRVDTVGMMFRFMEMQD